MMLVSAATGAVLAWVVVRYVLADNLLAYPLAACLLFLLNGAATLLQNHRPDLIVHGSVVAAAAILVVMAMAVTRLPQPEHA